MENIMLYLMNLSCCRKPLEVESCCVESHMIIRWSHWRRRQVKSICKIESYPIEPLRQLKEKSGRILSLHWLLDGRSCPVGLATAVEEDKGQHRVKPIWAAALHQDMAAWPENITLEIRHVHDHMAKSHIIEEHGNYEQVDKWSKLKYLD